MARKCNLGELSAAERSEYEAYIWAGRILALLRAKAQAILAEGAGSSRAR